MELSKNELEMIYLALLYIGIPMSITNNKGVKKIKSLRSKILEEIKRLKNENN